MKNKSQISLNEKADKKKPGKETLFKKLERIDKKLDLFNVLNKSVPAMFITTLALVSFLIYTRVSVVSVEEELPITGEEQTTRFRIIYPENNTSINSPFEIISVAIDGYYDETVTITFLAQDQDGSIITIGEATKGDQSGEYRADSGNLTPGSYLIWAKISDSETKNVLISESVSIDIRSNNE